MSSKSNPGMVDQVMTAVTSWIREGRFAVGDKLPSERELARQFGMNLLTVNKAMAMLAGDGVIARGSGRRGSHVARLPQKDSIVIICDIFHQLKSEHRVIDRLIEELMDSAQAHGYAPHFMLGRGADADDFLESLSIGSSLWNEVKGVISIAWKDGMDERFDAMSIPLVGVAGPCRHFVYYDFAEFGRAAAREVLKTDRPDKICLVHNLSFTPDAPESPLYTFKEELDRAKCQAKVVLVATDELTCATGERWARYLQKELESVDALVITDDNIAEGFARVLRRPEDPFVPRTIVTSANVGLIPDMPPHFKRIFFRQRDIADAAVAMLADLMQHRMPTDRHRRIDIKPLSMNPVSTSKNVSYITS